MCNDDEMSEQGADQGEATGGSSAKRPIKARSRANRDAVQELAFSIWKACEDSGDLRDNLFRAMAHWKARFIK